MPGPGWTSAPTTCPQASPLRITLRGLNSSLANLAKHLET